MAIDGLEVPAVTVSLSIQVGDVLQGPSAFEKPALIIHFFDQRRVPIGEHVIGPWLAESESWQKIASRIAVPPAAREAILQVGLNGATGKLCIDNVQLTPHRR
jgi:protein-L-isoaspartate(D-aspartate) O-methyltransferase